MRGDPPLIGRSREPPLYRALSDEPSAAGTERAAIIRPVRIRRRGLLRIPNPARWLDAARTFGRPLARWSRCCSRDAPPSPSPPPSPEGNALIVVVRPGPTYVVRRTERRACGPRARPAPALRRRAEAATDGGRRRQRGRTDGQGRARRGARRRRRPVPARQGRARQERGLAQRQRAVDRRLSRVEPVLIYNRDGFKPQSFRDLASAYGRRTSRAPGSRSRSPPCAPRIPR